MSENVPEDARQMLQRARSAAASKELAGAERILTQAVSRVPRDAELGLALGKVVAASGRLQVALPHFVSTTEADPENAEGWHLLGITATRLASGAEAIRALQCAVALAPDDEKSLASAAEAQFRWGTPEVAEKLYGTLVAMSPENALYRLRTAESMSRMGRFEDAKALLEHGAGLFPESADIFMALGEVREDLGLRTDARQAYMRALELRPAWAFPLAGLFSVDRHAVDPEHFACAESIVHDEQIHARERSILGYALGKALDALGRYEKAAETWRAANEARRSYAPAYSPSEFARYLEKVKALHLQLPDAFPEDGNIAQRPIFIVGMPRSGTTLTEQLLASRPGVHGAGELTEIGVLAKEARETPALLSEFAWRDAARERWLSAARRGAPPNVEILVDKAPLNFLHLWLIERLFPGCGIVWCRRDIRDVAVSIYGENFAVESSFATRIEDIVDYGRQQDALMRHWKSVLHLHVHTLEYEALVHDPVTVSTNLYDALDLPLSDVVHAYAGSDRPIATPSKWQVRQPIHAASAERWRRYPSLFTNINA